MDLVGFDALFPAMRRGVLAATLSSPEKWWYLSELAHHLRTTPSSLQREVPMLVKWEFLTNGGREQAPTLGQTEPLLYTGGCAPFSRRPPAESPLIMKKSLLWKAFRLGLSFPMC